MDYSAFILFKKCVCSQQTSIWKSSPPVGGTSTLKRPFCKGRAIQQKYIYSTTALYNALTMDADFVYDSDSNESCEKYWTQR